MTDGEALCVLARQKTDGAILQASDAAHCLLVRTQYLAALERWPMGMRTNTNA